MAYYFMVEKKKGQYESLNLNSMFASDYKRKFSKEGAYSLEELDMFTMQFNDELELRQALLTDNILGFDFITKPLSIRCLNKGKYSKVPYDFLYQKDLDLVLDPSKLVTLIMKRYYNNDFVFIKKFGECFLNYHECSITATEVARYADIAVKYNVGCKYLEERDTNNNNMVERLIKLLLFEYNENCNGYINYKDKIKYRNLHMMIAFINNYDVKYGYAPQKEKVELSDIVAVVKPKTRKRVKNEQIDGQISLFDAIDNNKKSQ